MITILHGDNQVSSRDKLNNITSQARLGKKEVISLDGKSADFTDIVQSLESQSLFAHDRLVVIENLLGPLTAGKRRDTIINYFCDGSFDADIVLWERKGVGRKLIKLKKQEHVTVEEFKMPVVIFKFVDNLYPNNHDLLLTTFHDTLSSNVPAEVVFTMTVRQFRLMLALSTNASISEVKRLAPWQKSRLLSQSKRFSERSLKVSYKQLMIIDYQIKTGKSPLDLTKRIEQFIIEL